MSIKGTLEGFLDSLYAKWPPEPGQLLGRVIQTQRPELGVILAIDRQDSVRLLLAPVSVSDETKDLPSHAGLRTNVVEWAVAGRPPQSYIDVCCDAPRGSPLRRPFLSFCEDVVQHLGSSTDSPQTALHRILVRWRRFWAPERNREVSLEWIKGLYGELIVLRHLVPSGAREAVAAWVGPVDPHRDFVGHRIGLEVKTAAARPAVVRIHSLQQLDPAGLDDLLLVLVLVEEVADGIALDGLVRELDTNLETNLDAHEEFLERLFQAGYRRECEDQYATRRFRVEAVVAYSVDNAFPSITSGSFVRPLDRRVLAVEYALEISGIDPVRAENFTRTLSRMLHHTSP